MDKVWVSTNFLKDIEGEGLKIKHEDKEMTITLENYKKLKPLKGKETYLDKKTRKPYKLIGFDWKPDPEVQSSMF
jgi:hypothetical protein